MLHNISCKINHCIDIWETPQPKRLMSNEQVWYQDNHNYFPHFHMQSKPNSMHEYRSRSTNFQINNANVSSKPTLTSIFVKDDMSMRQTLSLQPQYSSWTDLNQRGLCHVHMRPWSIPIDESSEENINQWENWKARSWNVKNKSMRNVLGIFIKPFILVFLINWFYIHCYGIVFGWIKID